MTKTEIIMLLHIIVLWVMYLVFFRRAWRLDRENTRLRFTLASISAEMSAVTGVKGRPLEPLEIEALPIGTTVEFEGERCVRVYDSASPLNGHRPWRDDKGTRRASALMRGAVVKTYPVRVR